MHKIKTVLLVILLLQLTSPPALAECAQIPSKIPDIKKCAEHGHAASQFMLYQLYSQGSEIPRNYKIALSWALKSADQGYLDAENALGMSYYNGWGTKPDKVRAYMWWSLSLANLNSPATRARIEILEDEMSREELDKAQAMATEWVEKHPKKK